MKTQVHFLLFAWLSIFTHSQTFATVQALEILIHQGDTVRFFGYPLEKHPDFKSFRDNLFGENKPCQTTACWRGYQGIWQVIDNQLYLIGLQSCCHYEDSIKADLEFIFGLQCINGKVKADWVTDDYLSPQGKILYTTNNSYGAVYEKEILLKFEMGILLKTEVFDNSKAKSSKYAQDIKHLYQYIYSQIDWEMIPNEPSTIKVFIKFSSNEEGLIDDVKILKGFSKIIDDQVMRIIKSLPFWEAYYSCGKHKRILYSIPVIFSQELKKKYQD